MKHLMGTDDIGRDTFSGVMHGASISLMVGVISAFIALIVGILLGAVSGYYGGKVDEALMRIADFFVVIPTTLLLIVIAAIFGPKLLMTAFIIGVLSFSITARVVRAEFLSWKEREFVESARLSGMSEWRIMLMEVLPNIMPLVIASATLQVAASMVFEASISFLGLGDPEFQSLGYMLYRSQLIYIRAWWTAAFPGLMLFLGALGINVAGEGLNEALNPRLRGR
jgi:peptide/nickel transport system permease protein